MEMDEEDEQQLFSTWGRLLGWDLDAGAGDKQTAELELRRKQALPLVALFLPCPFAAFVPYGPPGANSCAIVSGWLFCCCC